MKITSWNGLVSPGGIVPVALTIPEPGVAGLALNCSSKGNRFSNLRAGTKVSVWPAIPRSGGKRSLIITQQNLCNIILYKWTDSF